MTLLLALIACVPVSVLPPPTPLAKGASEAGLGVSYTFDDVVDRGIGALAEEQNQSWLETPFAPSGGIDGQIYYRYRVGKNFEAGAMAFYGQGGGGPGGGVYARVPFSIGKKLDLGIDAQLGLLWYAVGVPISYKVSKGFYITAEPMYRAGTIVIPAGVSYKPGGGWSLGAQGMYLHTTAKEGVDASGRFAAALTVGYRLGKDEEDTSNDNKGDGKKDKDKKPKKDKDGKKKGGGGGGDGGGTNR